MSGPSRKLAQALGRSSVVLQDANPNTRREDRGRSDDVRPGHGDTSKLLRVADTVQLTVAHLARGGRWSSRGSLLVRSHVENATDVSVAWYRSASSIRQFSNVTPSSWANRKNGQIEAAVDERDILDLRASENSPGQAHATDLDPGHPRFRGVRVRPVAPLDHGVPDSYTSKDRPGQVDVLDPTLDELEARRIATRQIRTPPDASHAPRPPGARPGCRTRGRPVSRVGRAREPAGTSSLVDQTRRKRTPSLYGKEGMFPWLHSVVPFTSPHRRMDAAWSVHPNGHVASSRYQTFHFFSVG